MKRYFVLMLVLCACIQELSDEKGTTYSSYIWYRTPAEIEATVTNAWGMELDHYHRRTYFHELGLSFGGSDKDGQVLIGDEPDILYSMAIARVAWWLADELVASVHREYKGTKLFDGGALDSSGCFDDDNQAWCDFDDKLTIGTYSKKDTERLKTTLSDRKKIMHNIQDIGDFVGVIADNKTTIDGDYDHLPHYLLDEVFIPHLGDLDDGEAWRMVTFSILLRGPFFMHFEQRKRRENL